MSSPIKRAVLRLTPIPEPSPKKSLIVKLCLPNSKSFLGDLDSQNKKQSSNNLDSDYLPGQHGDKPSTHVIKEHPKSLQELTQKNTTILQATRPPRNPTSLCRPVPPSSTASPASPVSAESEPDDSSYIALDALRADAAREIVTIFYLWGRDEIRMELDEALALQSATPDETELLQKIAWVRECLRGRYKVWIQASENYIIKEYRTRKASTDTHRELGMECEYPGCRRFWENGELRVSFEPPGWTEPEKATENVTGNEEEDSKTKEGGDRDDEPIMQLPDYQKLMTSRNIFKHGHGEFYCIRCFEKLLDAPEPTLSPALSQKKRKRSFPAAEKYPRPSPLCRIYASVFAETRIHAEGIFSLDEATAELVRRWKNGLFEEGMNGMIERFGDILGVDNEPRVKNEEGDWDLNVGEGRGLAELLAGAKEAKEVRDGMVASVKKRKKH